MSFSLLSIFYTKNNKFCWDMKSDLSVNGDGDNPKRLNQNLFKNLKKECTVEQTWGINENIFRPKVSYSF
jgi:hypothetical protein